MRKKRLIQWGTIALMVFGAWFFVRFGLRMVLPFLIGGGVALAAEPLVGFLDRRLRLPRWAATGVGVTTVFVLLTAVLVVLAALLVKEAGRLGGVLPELAETARQGMGSLEGWLLTMASQAPESLRPVLTNSVTGFFSDGSAMMDRVVDTALGAATGLVGRLSAGALSLGTGVLAAFMLSARLPQLRRELHRRIPKTWQETYIPALKGIGNSMLGWLWAQTKLVLVALVILLLGFQALQIPNGPLWAVAVSVVDAFPILGVGTVLIPWAVICLLQGQRVRGIGLLAVYVVIWLCRSVLEPKLVGKELGLDPLLTLAAMYGGFQLFGLTGLILSPVLTVAALRLYRVTVDRPEA